jgi:hypothetical protein
LPPARFARWPGDFWLRCRPSFILSHATARSAPVYTSLSPEPNRHANLAMQNVPGCLPDLPACRQNPKEQDRDGGNQEIKY